MTVRFAKMEGCGNDYVYIDGAEENVPHTPDLVRRLSDRHFGVGGDGVIFINPSDTADFEMEMWNADGTRGEMCGNGIRCVAKYVYDTGLTDRTVFTVESFGKVKTLTVHLSGGTVDTVDVDMGAASFAPAEIPVVTDLERFEAQPVEAGGNTYPVTCVSMGNPHAVIFLDETFPLPGTELADLPLETLGPLFENHALFPKRINTEFVRVDGPDVLSLRVWERGTGETLCCGTGCCAAAAAAMSAGRTGQKVTVRTKGGTVTVTKDERSGHLILTGPARFTFRGEIDV